MSSDEIDEYLQQFQGACTPGGGPCAISFHNPLPHVSSQLLYEYDNAVPSAPLGGDGSGDLPAEGQASAGGDWSTATDVTRRTAADAVAADTDAPIMANDSPPDLDISRARKDGGDPEVEAKGRLYSGGGGEGRFASYMRGHEDIDNQDGTIGEDGRLRPDKAREGDVDDGCGRHVRAKLDTAEREHGDIDNDDTPIVERQWQIVQKTKQRYVWVWESRTAVCLRRGFRCWYGAQHGEIKIDGATCTDRSTRVKQRRCLFGVVLRHMHGGGNGDGNVVAR